MTSSRSISCSMSVVNHIRILPVLVSSISKAINSFAVLSVCCFVHQRARECRVIGLFLTYMLSFTPSHPSFFIAFKQLHDKVCKTAYLLSKSPQYGFEVRTATSQNDEEAAKSKLVAGLLAPSCEDFLVETFALFRLGWSVLLIA